MERLTEKVNGCNQIIKCGNDLCKETCEERSCDFCPISEAIDKLAEYEDAEEQGSLLRLPCKVGGTVYYFMNVDDVIVISEHKMATLTNIVALLEDENFGKTVFLTKEEAEQALKQMENERMKKKPYCKRKRCSYLFGMKKEHIFCIYCCHRVKENEHDGE